MSKVVLWGLMSVLAGAAYASEAGEGAIVPPHQAVVQVKGVVCSFCAYGTEKNLSKLQFLDSAQFGNGVLMDIHANRITLALTPGKPVDLKGIHEAIVKGGYDPVRVHLRLRGTLERHGDRYLLTVSETGQVFELTPRGLEPLPERGVVEIQAHLEADQIPLLAEGQPIRVTVDRVESVA